MSCLESAIAVVAAAIIACVIVKLRLRKRLESIDGLGGISHGGENDIASLGDAAEKDDRG